MPSLSFALPRVFGPESPLFSSRLVISRIVTATGWQGRAAGPHFGRPNLGNCTCRAPSRPPEGVRHARHPIPRWIEARELGPAHPTPHHHTGSAHRGTIDTTSGRV